MDKTQVLLFKRIIQLLLLGTPLKFNKVTFRFARAATVLYEHPEKGEVIAERDGFYKYVQLRQTVLDKDNVQMSSTTYKGWVYQGIKFSTLLEFIRLNAGKIYQYSAKPVHPKVLDACIPSLVVNNMVALSEGHGIEIEGVYYKYCLSGCLIGISLDSGAKYASESGIYQWVGAGFELVSFVFEDLVDILESAKTLQVVKAAA